MSTNSWKDIAELIGIAALVASLIFVGLQMRQAHEIARAATYQARTDSEMTLIGLMLESEALERASVKQWLGEPLTEYEERVRAMYFLARLMYYENVHYQWEQGMLTDDYWQAQREGLKSGGFDSELFRETWQGARVSFRDSFVRAVDDALAEIETAE